MGIVSSVASTTKDFFSSLSFDVLVLVALVGFFFLLALRMGKTRLINIVLSVYIASFLLLFFPFKNAINFDLGLLFGKYGILDLLLLLIVTGGVQVVVGYVLELEFERRLLRNTINNLILSISAAFAVLAGAYITGAVKATNASISFLDGLYTNEQYLFALLILPLVGVFIVAR